jgi:hypothetical protein
MPLVVIPFDKSWLQLPAASADVVPLQVALFMGHEKPDALPERVRLVIPAKDSQR